MDSFAKLIVALAAVIPLLLCAADASRAAWLSEPVATTTTGLDAAAPRLAIDNEGAPHIAFPQPGVGFPLTTYPIGYVRKSGGSWVIETVIDSAGAEAHVAIDTDPSGNPGIAIVSTVDEVNASLALKTESGWFVERADSVPVLAVRPTLFGNLVDVEFDPSGNAVLSYFGQSITRPVRVAFKVGGAWSHDTVEGLPGNMTLSQLSLDLTSEGEPAVAWSVNGVASYARKSGGSWSVEQFTAQGPAVSLALDGDERPHIAFAQPDSNWLSYATKSGDGWTIEVVDTNGVETRTSIAIDRDGAPHIVYETGSGVRYATRSGGAWTLMLVSGGVNEPEIAMDRVTYAPREFPRVVFRDGANLVRYAYPDPTPVGGPPEFAVRPLLSVFPNPALAGRLRVLYRIPLAGEFSLAIFDAAGRRVRALAEGSASVESGTIAWDGRDESGRAVASGAYFLRLESERASTTERVILIR